MDHRGRALDNIFTERLWRSAKYEEVYLHDSRGPCGSCRYRRSPRVSFYETAICNLGLNGLLPHRERLNLFCAKPG